MTTPTNKTAGADGTMGRGATREYLGLAGRLLRRRDCAALPIRALFLWLLMPETNPSIGNELR